MDRGTVDILGELILYTCSITPLTSIENMEGHSIVVRGDIKIQFL